MCENIILNISKHYIRSKKMADCTSNSINVCVRMCVCVHVCVYENIILNKTEKYR